MPESNEKERVSARPLCGDSECFFCRKQFQQHHAAVALAVVESAHHIMLCEKLKAAAASIMVDAESVENVPLPTAQRRADLVASVLKVVDADNKSDIYLIQNITSPNVLK